MVNIVTRKSKQIPTKQDLDDIQQPLSKDGYTNERFCKLYGDESNPSIGTERDRKNKKNIKILSSEEQKKYEIGWEKAFGKNEKPVKRKI